ncbi:DNA-binding MarR family transcriptional regulator [Kitasatospora sp. SolWspMP-SS2h]|uniref:MarR family winged helix-turn-helix transcriptional regulator n=1 Tax=Kitasatospora sp. SolWspMP-SS2h TaxID=1305729 RepID=UPI000DB9C92C|nr:MarR family transcriptional regulator [Kitasatospora sp. SolWspMP-SS2h]RAJ41749.1 DNA-binding MarR family transcriptional regulator [Kitasatospora sp. SolWspMP-SS2h]
MPTTESELPFDQRLGSLIKQAEQALIAEKNRVLRPFGLTVPQYSALLLLAENPNISGARLARICGVTAQAMNGVISLLDQRKLISRTNSPDHAKVLLLRLTRAGTALLRKADREAVAVERRLMHSFDDQDLAAFRKQLTIAIEVLSEHADS